MSTDSFLDILKSLAPRYPSQILTNNIQLIQNDQYCMGVDVRPEC